MCRGVPNRSIHEMVPDGHVYTCSIFVPPLSCSCNAYTREICQLLLLEILFWYTGVELFVSVCRYFSLQASEPLGMGDGVRVEVESRICDDRGPRADSYLPPQLIAYDIMTEARITHTDISYHSQFLQEL